MTTTETDWRAEQLDWRAEPDPMVADAWAVFLYLGERRQSMVVGNLSEPTARLIAAAPAKAALCEELADALEQAKSELVYTKEKLPYSNAASTLRIVASVLAKAKAGRAPQ